jgi:caffeoyl-CoA O-methyltransferase
VRKIFSIILLSSFLTVFNLCSSVQENSETKKIDETIKAFFEYKYWPWYDATVPEADAKRLYDIILKNKYKKALEIGTSTGYSGIWIAWALSKTGGKLITIEIDKERYSQAVENFKKAGLSDYVDARLADAHDLTKELPGPFDFIFSDADKDWYKNYFLELFPKLEKGGCSATHNIGVELWGKETNEYYNYIKNLKSIKTTVYTDGEGLAVSYKK